ncbi:lysylphosphatidylglycerol synthase transmembrane domain-containing protein [Hydrogenophaga flava]|uniref:lysylphosphatidylglycerol synthase transmembrane domain-containing protein n=1 Tax=Hydrogenophaga flava TaxID=65657 RepID=UPI0008269F57|nr:lysylphosphatidylglycerol synthase transmembrane domain-containing protein [Hydrogenophaga flava]
MTHASASTLTGEAAPRPSRSARYWLLRGLALALLLASCGYFGYHLWDNLHQLPPIEWGWSAVGVIALAVLGCLTSVPLIALMWQLLLRDQGVKLPYRQALQIIAVSQMGKYLPGNVGHFAGRVLLGSQAGIPAGKTIATMAMETFWVLGISGIFAVAALLFVVNDLHEGLVDTSHPGYLAAVAVTMLVAPFLAVRVVNRLLPGLSRKLGRGQLLAEPRLLTAMSVAGLIAFSFVVLGAVVELLAAELFQHPEIDLLEMVLLFAVSWTAGFLVPGSPGGIGVREAVMIQLMGPAIGLETALGVALVMRLCSMGADALAFGVGLLFRPRPQPPADDGL